MNDNDAIISACGTYRYVLTRRVGPEDKTAFFIMLNPSTADARTNDKTIRRCMGFTRRWGCGRLVVLNLFAFRATDPAELKQAADPVGPQNKAWFEKILSSRGEGPVVCAWGAYGSLLGQDKVVLGRLDELGVKPKALGVTRAGHPRHPLYLPNEAALQEFRACRTQTCPRRPFMHPNHPLDGGPVLVDPRILITQESIDGYPSMKKMLFAFLSLNEVLKEEIYSIFGIGEDAKNEVEDKKLARCVELFRQTRNSTKDHYPQLWKEIRTRYMDLFGEAPPSPPAEETP